MPQPKRFFGFMVLTFFSTILLTAQERVVTEIEPNNTTATATLPTPPGDEGRGFRKVILLGRLENGDDLDVMQINLTAGETLSLYLEGADQQDPPSLVLRDPQGSVIQRLTNDVANRNLTLPGYLVPTTGAYYLQVDSNGETLDAALYYRLRVFAASQPTLEQDGDGANDTLVTAEPLSFETFPGRNQTQVAGQVLSTVIRGGPADQDYFTLGRLTAGQQVAVIAHQPQRTPFLPQLSLVDEADGVLVTNRGSLNYEIPATGTYAVRVTSVDYVGNYGFFPDQAYHLKVALSDHTVFQVLDVQNLPAADSETDKLIGGFTVVFTQPAREPFAAGAAVLTDAVDGVFDNGDDIHIPISVSTQTTHAVTFSIDDGPLYQGRYRLTLNQGVLSASGDPFDGDQDGAAGGVYHHPFEIRLPIGFQLEDRDNESYLTATPFDFVADPGELPFFRLNQPILGSIDPNGDRDMYRFFARQDETYDIRVDGQGLGRWRLLLWRVSDGELVSDRTSFPPFTSLNMTIGGLESDGYFLEISNLSHGVPGNYVVSAVKTADLPLEVSPPPFTLDGGERSARVVGFIDAPLFDEADRDSYSLGGLSPGDVVEVDLTRFNDTAWRARLSLDGYNLGTVATTLNDTLRFTIIEGGSYTLNVTGAELHDFGDQARYQIDMVVRDEIPPQVVSHSLPTMDKPGLQPLEQFEVAFSERTRRSANHPDAIPTLVEAGPDGFFDSADDVAYNLWVGSNLSAFPKYEIQNGPLSTGHYRLRLAPGREDDVGFLLDGNGDGVGGDAFYHEFRLLLPDGFILEDGYNGNPDVATALSLVEDPVGSGHFRLAAPGMGQFHGDFDYWQLPLQAGDRLNLYADTFAGYMDVFGGFGPPLELVLRPAESQTSRIADLQTTAGNSVVLSDYVAPSDGTYLIRLQRSQGGWANYQLHAQVLRGPEHNIESDYRDANDSLAGAEPVVYVTENGGKQAVAYGTITPHHGLVGDLDHWDLGTFLAGDPLTLSIERPSNGRLAATIRVFDSQGQAVADADGRPDDDHFEAILPADGRYIAQIGQHYWAFQGRRYQLTTATGFEAAVAEADVRGATLATIDSLEEQTFLWYYLARTIDIGLGLNDGNQDGQWTWQDGTPLDLDCWAENSPAPQGTSVSVLDHRRGQWVDREDDPHHYVLESADSDPQALAAPGAFAQYILHIRPGDQQPPQVVALPDLPPSGADTRAPSDFLTVQFSESLDPASLPSAPDWVLVGNTTFYVSPEEMTRPQAAAWAQERGLVLATIADAEQDLAVFRLLGYERLWLGLQDSDGDRVYTWDGDDSPYRNWENNPAPYPYVTLHPFSGKWIAEPETQTARALVAFETGTHPDADGDGLIDAVDLFPADAGNAWSLTAAGADEVFDSNDDRNYPLLLVDRNAVVDEITLKVADHSLPEGRYRLTLSGQIHDTGGNGLDGNGDGQGGDDFHHFFNVRYRVAPYTSAGERNHNVAAAVPLTLTPSNADGRLLLTEAHGFGAVFAGDRDYFSFEGRAGDRIALTAEPRFDSDWHGLSVLLFNDDLSYRFGNTATANGVAAQISNHLLDRDGTYYFAVGYANGNTHYQAHLEIARNLQLETDAGDNNHPTQAESLMFTPQAGGQAAELTGSLARQDIDYFLIGALPVGQALTITPTLLPEATLAPRFLLLDPNLQTVAESSGSVMHWQVTEEGPYYLVVDNQPYRVRNGRRYHISDDLTYDALVNDADLEPAVIVDREEFEDVVQWVLGNAVRSVGYLDLDLDGDFDWIDGHPDPGDFLNWAQGEPHRGNAVARIDGNHGWWGTRRASSQQRWLIKDNDPAERDLVAPGPYGQYLFRVEMFDNAPPFLRQTEGLPDQNGVARFSFTTFSLQFSEPISLDSLRMSHQTPAEFDLRRAGDDGLFDTTDDITLQLQFSSSQDQRTFDLRILDGPPQAGFYRFTIPAGLTDLAGNPFDGNHDGLGGDPLFRHFHINVPENVVFERFDNHEPQNGATLVLREDPAGSGFFQTEQDGYGVLEPLDDLDFWRFEGRAGAQVAVWVVPQQPGLQVNLDLHDPAGNPIGAATDGAANLDGENRSAYLSFAELPSDGTYRILIQEGSLAPGETDYRLRLEMGVGVQLESDVRDANRHAANADHLVFTPSNGADYARFAGKIAPALNNVRDRDTFDLSERNPGTTILLAQQPMTHSTLQPQITLVNRLEEPLGIRQGPRTGYLRLDVTETNDYAAAIAGVNGDGRQAHYLLDTLILPTQSLDFADLAAVDVHHPEQAQAGANVQLTWRVGNYGAGPTAVTQRLDRVVLSMDDQLGNSDDRVLTEVVRNTTLAAGSFDTVTVNPALPADLTGAWWVFVLADADNHVPELIFETNNADHGAAPLLIHADNTGPQLRVSSLSVDPSLTPNSQVTLRWTLANLGQTDAPASYDRLWLSQDNLLGDDLLLGRFRAKPLAAASDVIRTVPFKVPTTLGISGSLYLILESDSDHQITESDESDNITITAVDVPERIFLEVNDTQLNEGQSTLAHITRSGALDTALNLNLGGQPDGEIEVPASLSLASGVVQQSFTVTARADGIPEPNETVQLHIGNGTLAAVADLLIRDHDRNSLQMTLGTSSLLEGQTTTITLRRLGDTTERVTVYLAATPAVRLNLAKQTHFEIGAAETSLNIQFVDDDLVDAGRETITIVARAEGYHAAQQNLTLVDNDTPTLALQPAGETLFENAAQPLSLRVQRATPAGAPLHIKLSAEPAGLVDLPESITIPADQSAVQFTLFPRDNDLVDGTRSATITAVAVATRTGLALAETAVSQTITLLDDESRLRWDLEQIALPSGAETVATLTRGGDPRAALEVVLSAAPAAAVLLPERVLFQPGANQTTFPVATRQSEQVGDLAVVLSAAAPGFESSSSTLTVTDRARPNLYVETILLPAELPAGEPFTVTYRVRNRGTAPARVDSRDGAIAAWSDRILFARDRAPGNDILAAEPSSGRVLAPGEALTRARLVTAPNEIGTFWIRIETDIHNQVLELDTSDNRHISRNPFHTVTPYDITVNAAWADADGTRGVRISGEARRHLTQTPAAEGPLVIHITHDNWTRTVSVQTDAAGHFETLFTPSPEETGRFLISAAYPGDPSPTATTTFDLGGAVWHHLDQVVAVAGTSTRTLLSLENPGNVPITQLALSADTPPGISIAFDVFGETNLPAATSLPVALVLHATEVPANPEWVTLHVSGDSGLVQSHSLAVPARGDHPALKCPIPRIEAAYTPGRQRLVRVPLTYNGVTASGPIERLSTGLSWFNWVHDNTLPSMAPGSSRTLNLLLNPPADLSPGPWSGWLTLKTADQLLTIPYSFFEAGNTTATLGFTLVDELHYFSPQQPTVAGATVHLRHADQTQPVATAGSDELGRVQLTGIEAGDYWVEVFSPNHDSPPIAITVEAGRDDHRTLFLSRRTVHREQVAQGTPPNIQWMVQNRVEANQNMPVVDIEPASLDLSALSAADDLMTVTLKVTNHGLIDAERVHLVRATQGRYLIESPRDDLGPLPALSQKTIPIRIRLSASAGNSKTAPCDSALAVVFEYRCGDRRIKKVLDVPLFHPDCSHLRPTALLDHLLTGLDLQPADPVQGADCLTCALPLPAYFPAAPPAGRHNDPTRQLAAAAGTLFKSCDPLPNYLACITAWFDCMRVDDGLTPETALACADLGACLATRGKQTPAPLGETAWGCAQRYLALTESPAFQGLLSADHPLTAPTAALQQRLSWVAAWLEPWRTFAGDTALLNAQSGSAFLDFMMTWSRLTAPNSEDGRLFSAAEQAVLENTRPPEGLQAADVTALIQRWQHTQVSYIAGIYSSQDAPPGWDPDFIARDMAASVATLAQQAQNDAVSAGFVNPLAALEAAVTDLAVIVDHLNDPTTTGPLLATALHLDRTVTTGSMPVTVGLTLNHHGNETLEDVNLAWTLTDASGDPVDAQFATVRTNSDGFAEGGHLSGGGSALIQRTLAFNAADDLTNPITVHFSGALQFRSQGTLQSMDLPEQVLVVLPRPSLQLETFAPVTVPGAKPTGEPGPVSGWAAVLTNTGNRRLYGAQIQMTEPALTQNSNDTPQPFQLLTTQINHLAGEADLGVNLGDLEPGTRGLALWHLRTEHDSHVSASRLTVRVHDAVAGNTPIHVKRSVRRATVHVFEADGDFDDGRPDFLVDAIADPQNLGDHVFLSDGSVAPVTHAASAAITGTLSPDNREVTLTLPTHSGWQLARVSDPAQGTRYLQSAQKPQGEQLRIGHDLWQRQRRYLQPDQPPLEQPELNALLFNGAGAYTLHYGDQSDRGPGETHFEPVLGDPLDAPRDSATVTFSFPIAADTFTTADLQLTRNDLAIPLPTLSISAVSATRFVVSGLTPAVSQDGVYRLVLDLSGIADPFGNVGSGNATLGWVQAAEAPAVVALVGPKQTWRNNPLEQVDVLFNRPIQTNTFSLDDLTLTRNQTPINLTDPVTVFAAAENRMQIRGLDHVTAVEGTYQLSVQTNGVLGTNDVAGLGTPTLTWHLDQTAPAVAIEPQVGSRDEEPFQGQFLIRLSEPLPPGAVDLSMLTLTRDNGPNLLGPHTPLHQEGDHYRLLNLFAIVDDPQAIYTLTFDETRLYDRAGNRGTRMLQDSWSLQRPPANDPGSLTFTPNSGYPYDSITNQTELVLRIGPATAVERLHLYDLTSNRYLGEASSSGQIKIKTVYLPEAGPHQIRAVAYRGNDRNQRDYIITIDQTPPALISVTPTPNQPEVPPSTITWRFQEDLATVITADLLQLFRDGTALSLPGGLVISQPDPRTVQVSGLAAVGSEAGRYQIRFNLANVADVAGNPATGFHDSHWTQANRAPQIASLPDQTIEAGQTLTLTATASDPDQHEIRFSLAEGAPEGATMSAAGTFTWQPRAQTTPGRYSVMVRATDNGSPPLSDQTGFTINLVSPTLVRLTLQREPIQGGRVSGDGAFPVGALAVIQAVPYPFYRFIRWRGDGISNDASASTSVVMSEARSVTAEFASTAVALHFPDPQLAATLLRQFDRDQSGYLDSEEASLVTLIDISSLGIHDLSGLEAFTNLQSLHAAHNFLSELPADLPPNLDDVDLAYNRLSDISVLTAHPQLGDHRQHRLALDHNLLNADACPSLLFLSTRFNESGALLILNPMGNLTTIVSSWSGRPAETSVLNLVEAVNTETPFTYLLSCP